jgi:hypothetical protein
LGDHLDTNRARTFSVLWTPNSVIFDYKKTAGLKDWLRFAPTKLADDVVGGGFLVLFRDTNEVAGLSHPEATDHDHRFFLTD